ncbi:hypothetical protein C8F04DRAFT_1084372 [Mycena alexandri]|uniref:Uncharacterized protein n=1 Tax=Mycena alexandri TaxID=1745969 RepID=A0AAD6X5P9_9AGAR|nr:hypothetical protein C8F04DRAFT_1084372 [Mycena alexandri]
MASTIAGPSKAARKNELVVIDDSSDDDVAPRPPKAVKVEKKIPALDFGLPKKPAAAASKPKAAHKTKVAPPPPTIPAFTPAIPTVPGGLPAFVAHLWTPVVMPLLHRALNESDAPWELGYNNMQTFTVVKEVVNVACPGNNYKPVWNDPLVSRACARLGERRSAAGTGGVDVVADFLADTVKFPTQQSIQDFVRYALNKRGPGLFKNPTPLKRIHITNPEDPKYVKASGLFESDFIIAVAAPLLKVGGTKLPYGAIALAAGSVERGLVKHRTGVLETKSNFTKTTAGDAVAGYLISTQDLSERAWGRIIDACNTVSAQAVEVSSSPEAANMSLDGAREGLYEPSSP